MLCYYCIFFSLTSTLPLLSWNKTFSCTEKLVIFIGIVILEICAGLNKIYGMTWKLSFNLLNSAILAVGYVKRLNIPTGMVGACRLDVAYEHFKVCLMDLDGPVWCLSILCYYKKMLSTWVLEYINLNQLFVSWYLIGTVCFCWIFTSSSPFCFGFIYYFLWGLVWYAYHTVYGMLSLMLYSFSLQATYTSHLWSWKLSSIYHRLRWLWIWW